MMAVPTPEIAIMRLSSYVEEAAALVALSLVVACVYVWAALISDCVRREGRVFCSSADCPQENLVRRQSRAVGSGRQ